MVKIRTQNVDGYVTWYPFIRRSCITDYEADFMMETKTKNMGEDEDADGKNLGTFQGEDQRWRSKSGNSD